ncbi:hypothetical protein K502DRAFT_278127, partial [Neoconidiobolus thromboides FSU 785]
KIAILLHPYGPLGGTMHDPLIVSLSRQLNLLGYLVIRPNLRGSGNSGGRTTWTGSSECEDLYLLIKSIFLKEESLLKDIINTPITNFNCKKLMVLGYSYGSVIASKINGETSSEITTFYLALISYPYGYLWALTLFNSTKFNQYLKEAVELTKADEMKLFLCFGTRDQFTSLEHYQEWISNFFEHIEEGRTTDNMVYHIRKDADHFWR